MYILLLIVVLVPSLVVSGIFKNRRKKYLNVPLAVGMSGKDVAEKMLRENGISDVQVLVSDGMLTDHYDPRSKKVNLSTDIFYGKSVFSAAVAAHECGHAVQHATSYTALKLRTAMVPAVTFSSKIVMFAIFGGMILMSLGKNMFGMGQNLLLVGIVLFGITTIFSFITLPVEFNASARATHWLQTAGLTSHTETIQVNDALRWAAMTYVVAAFASLVNLLYYIMIFMGRRN